MAEFYFSVNLDNFRTLCLAPLTDRLIASCETEISDPSGYYLFEKRGSGDMENIEVIAHVVSDEAVFRLRDMFNMA